MNARFEGEGWRALLKQARYLEKHPEEVHVLLAFDPFTEKVHEVILTTRAEVLEMVGMLRRRANEFRMQEEASPWN